MGILKVYDGSSWTTSVGKVYDGTVWRDRMHVYDGTEQLPLYPVGQFGEVRLSGTSVSPINALDTDVSIADVVYSASASHQRPVVIAMFRTPVSEVTLPDCLDNPFTKARRFPNCWDTCCGGVFTSVMCAIAPSL